MNNFIENTNIVPSGYRILYVLYLLVNNNFSQKEINQKLIQNPYIEQSFTKETLQKIINTIKISDISLLKNKNKYSVSKLPWGMSLERKHVKTIKNLTEFVDSLSQKELIKEYNDFLKSLFRFLPYELSEELELVNYKKKLDFNDEKHASLIKKIEQAHKNEYRIKVILHASLDFLFDTYQIEYSSNKIFLTGYSIKFHENKTFNLDEIKSIKQLPQKSSGIFFPSNVTFKLKGRLAKAYNLKEHEKLITFNEDEIIVANKGEDRKKLFRRLLKYKDLCEIVTTEAIKSDFKQMLKNVLQNYQAQ